MKRLIKVLKVTITFMLLALFIGCSKSDDITHPNDGGNNGGTAKLSLNVMVASDSLFPNQGTMINWSTNKPATVGNTTGTSGSMNVGPFNGFPTTNNNTTVSVNAVAGTESDSKSVSIVVFSDFLANLCWNYQKNDYGRWKNTDVTVDGVSTPVLKDSTGMWSYQPNGRRPYYVNGQYVGSGYYYLIFSGGDVTINLGAASDPPNPYKVDVLTATSFIISKVSNGSTIRRFYLKE